CLISAPAARPGENGREGARVPHPRATTERHPGHDTRAVVDGTPGPLVDGTEYHSPEFAEQAKEYHQRVLIAHKEHAAVEVPLPTLNGQTASPPGLVAAEEPAPTGPPPGPGRGDGRRSRGNSRRRKKT